MKLNQLRDFVAVAQSGSLRGAARSLGLAQPAITRSIQELEHSLGTQLFLRGAKGVTLTAMGQKLLVRAHLILSEVRRATEEVHQSRGSVEGELVVGLSIAGHMAILPEILRTFQSRYPRVKLRLIEGFLPTLEADLKKGLVDIFIGPTEAGGELRDLKVIKLFDNLRTVVARIGHPLAKATSLDQLAGASWLTTTITHNEADELGSIFSEHGLPPPHLALQCQSALSVLTALVGSDLLAMLPIQWTRSPLTKDLLVPIPLRAAIAAPPMMLVHGAGIGLTPAADFFVQLALRKANTIQRAGADAL